LSPVPFEVTSSERSGVRIISVSGELDLATAPGFESPLNAALASGDSTLIIDLSACEFVDSTGIALIVSAWRQLDRNGDGNGRGRLLLCGIRGQVHRVFEISGLESAIPMRGSLEEALADLGTVERLEGELGDRPPFEFPSPFTPPWFGGSRSVVGLEPLGTDD
jgi:anti-sigma B factor antagonist